MTRRILPALLALVAPSFAFGGSVPAPPPPPGQLCRHAIDAAERAHGIPAHLLAAVAHVESGRRDPVTGRVDPWPWTINKDGQGSFYDIKAQAVAAAQSMRPRVAKSIDVGCMQISLTQHPDAFPTMDQAFDPASNADYGARFLLMLYEKTQSWPKAVGLYHSATRDLGNEYQARVYAALPEEQKLAATSAPSASALGPGWTQSPFARLMPQSVPHVIPLSSAPGSPAAPGKTLDAYRAAPVRLASRMP